MYKLLSIIVLGVVLLIYGCDGSGPTPTPPVTGTYPSLGQFGVVEIDPSTIDCNDPNVIYNSLYDWGPNNPDANGVYDASRAGVKRCF